MNQFSVFTPFLTISSFTQYINLLYLLLLSELFLDIPHNITWILIFNDNVKVCILLKYGTDSYYKGITLCLQVKTTNTTPKLAYMKR